MQKTTIDLNCDSGESYGNFLIGNDKQIFPHISSCNIACGFHGGDPLTIEKTIKLAIENNLQIGAHPSYPDLAGFGRRKMNIEFSELVAILKYQISALKGMVESHGGKLSYVKPHGALYNFASQNRTEAFAVISAIKQIDSNLAFMCLANSESETVAKEENISFIPEAFADRHYHNSGKLVSRLEKNAVITDPLIAVEQVLSIFFEKKVKTIEGDWLNLEAQSFCIHGDNPNAVQILMALKKAIVRKNIILKNEF